MFNGRFQEAENSSASFPEDSVASFGLLVEWIYTGSIPEIRKLESGCSSWNAQELYKLADKLCAVNLADLVMDKYRKSLNIINTLPSVSDILKAYAQIPVASGYCKFAAKALVYVFLEARNPKGLRLWPLAKIQEALGQSESLRNDFIRLLHKNQHSVFPDPRGDPDCDYHSHVKDEECYAKQKQE